MPACSTARPPTSRAQDGDATAFAEAALGFAAGLGGFEVRLVDREQNDLLADALEAPRRRRARAAGAPDGPAGGRPGVHGGRRRIPALSNDAVTLARSAGDLRALGAALAAHCDAHAGPTTSTSGQAEATEILDDRPDARRPRPRSCSALRLRVVAHWERGRMREAEADVREFGRLAERLGQPQYAWYVPLWRGVAAHLAGDLDTVARCADEVSAYAGPADSRNAHVLGVVHAAGPSSSAVRTPSSWPRSCGPSANGSSWRPTAATWSRAVPRQPPDLRARAVRHLPRVLAALPKDKEWLPNLHNASEGLLERDLRGEPAALLYAALAPYPDLFFVDGIGAGADGLGGAGARQHGHAGG